jgi:RNA polymerase sigma factor (sigma-70 family)
MEDAQLLKQYVETGSHDAFASLVNRHVNFVYAAALRHVRNAEIAEDVTQAVFIVLSKKAHTLRHEAVLSSWLLSTTRFAALSTMKMAHRRRHHEKKVAEMTPVMATSDPDLQWAELQEMLDAAIGKLRDSDRKAILLRFYERKSFAEIGSILGTAEEAARKRVSRAVDQLRTIFAQQEKVIPAAALATLLFTKLAPPAPAGLAQSVTAAALAAAPPAFSGDIAKKITQHMVADKTRRVAQIAAALTLIIGLGIVAAVQTRNLLRSPPPAQDRPAASTPASATPAPAKVLLQ